MPFLAASLFLSQQADPERLTIGRAGTSKVAPGQIWDLRSDKAASLADVVEAAKGKKWVFVGENHATKLHQQMEADVVQALVDAGRKPAVGVEFFQRPKQDVLDLWGKGELTEEQFLEQADWKKQWGFAYDFYRPLFEAVKKNKLQLLGLNVPRDWVRAAGKGGHAALSNSARMQLPPEMFLGNKDHRAVFEALIGGHPKDMAAAVDNMYSAQVLWDEGMADTALKYAAYAKPDLVVVVAGSGHVMYGQGINFRVKRRRGGDGVTLVMTQSEGSVELSRGMADFAFVTRPEPKPKKE